MSRPIGKIEIDGREQSVEEWANEKGIAPNTLRRRLQDGWIPDIAVEALPRETQAEAARRLGYGKARLPVVPGFVRSSRERRDDCSRYSDCLGAAAKRFKNAEAGCVGGCPGYEAATLGAGGGLVSSAGALRTETPCISSGVLRCGMGF